VKRRVTGRVCAVALMALLALGVVSAGPIGVPSPERLLEHVKTLSAPENEGRASGTAGAERAARQIAAEFRRAGLAPGGDAGTYFQSFSVPTGIRLGSTNTLTLASSGRALGLGTEFTPLAVSSDGSVDATLVFAGYGITARDLGYDDYAGLDVRGKIVLVLTAEPRPGDPASPFRQPQAYHYSERSHKIINAREHGAVGVLLVTHPALSREALPVVAGISQPASILSAFVTRAVGDALLAPAGTRLVDAAAAIDRPLAPQSFPVPGTRVRLSVDLVREHGTTANVVAVVPGTDARLRDEAVVVGAHYDHLGRGGEGSLAPEQAGTIHPGADDNASGTAGLLELARMFATGVPRTLVFVAFAGEEMGMLGSTHYIQHPARPLERTALMVNLDMIGRLREGKLHVSGVDSGTGLRALVSGVPSGGLDLQLRSDPFGPSDHAAFYAAGRPVLFLFTGAHAEYHRPGDTWDKIDARGLAAVTAFTARLVAAVAAAPSPPTYVRLQGPPARERGGYGPFFGVVPEFGERKDRGVRVTGVRPDSPAEKAGVQAGDVIVTFAGVGITTLEDFTFALRGRRGGDHVDVTIVRDGVERRLDAVLEDRR
jgi:peptidase M28-like protein/PDZ domain-containing protein/PA domain-containing protein